MDFKAALLKSQPSIAVVNTFKPTAKLDGKSAHPTDSFNASGGEERINIVKVGWPLSYFPFRYFEDY